MEDNASNVFEFVHISNRHAKRRIDDSENDYFISDEETQLLNKGVVPQISKEDTEKQDKYPKSVFFILGNEFCERFCYYGMRTILTIYLTEELLYGDEMAKVIFHASIMLSYFTPVFGAIIADSFLGKFKTILYISIIYAIGNVTLSAGSIPNALSTMKAVSLLGLLIIGIGTGGIKPCVSAFGGDQFSSRQEKERQKFFSIFYFAINCGSVISTLTTPVLRKDVKCFGSNSCYPLAFGVPAVLMIVALILFLCGRPLYKIRKSDGNIFASVFKCISHAISRKFKSSEKKREHWLDHADDKFDKTLIKDIQNLLHVLWIFIPVPLFWALFDQTGSSWTLQATKMNGEFLGYHIKPDQMQVMNSILIVIFIPIFDYGVYPLLAKCNLLKKPLQRIAVGGLLSAVSFVLVGFVELKLEGTYPSFPGPNFSELTIINNSPCSITLNSNMTLGPHQISTLKDFPRGTETSWAFVPTNCSATQQVEKTFNTTSPFESLMITLQNRKLEIFQNLESKQRTDDGEPKIRLYFSTNYEFQDNETSFKVEGPAQLKMTLNNSDLPSTFGATKYFKTMPGKYKLYLPINSTAHQNISIGELDLRSSGIYIGVLYQTKSQNGEETTFIIHPLVNQSSVSILWQIPGYVVLTAGEIMFSITGLEFSYSQAPASMKSIVQASWLLTTAFGNLIVLIIAKLKLFEKESYELFLFAVLMGLDMLLFAIMAYFYKYVKSDDDSPTKSTTSNGKENKAFEVEETDFNK